MTKLKDSMRPEYDMTGGVRGKYAGRFPKDVVMVTLALPVRDVSSELVATMLMAFGEGVEIGAV